MKYEETKVKGFTKQTLRELEKIALEESPSLEDRGGIDGRNNDSEDFPEVSIYSIQKMLERAYLLGKAAGQKETK